MTEAEVEAFLLALHATWPKGDLAALRDYYHPDVLLLPPDLGQPIHGREAVVASYGEFLDAATLEHFEVTGLKVYAYSNAATFMAHLTFAVSYSLDGSRYQETGLEIYAVSEIGGRPKILWRQQSVLDSQLAGGEKG